MEDLFSLSEIRETCLGRHRTLYKNEEAILHILDRFNNTCLILRLIKEPSTTSKTLYNKGIVKYNLEDIDIDKALILI